MEQSKNTERAKSPMDILGVKKLNVLEQNVIRGGAAGHHHHDTGSSHHHDSGSSHHHDVSEFGL